jgi:polysaccharide deacetylase family protein (PEP-CTERM system associated)
MLNALTIDIEDYFQVQAFSNVIKYEDWNNYECRIERNTDRILYILNEASQNSKFKSQNSKLNQSVTQHTTLDTQHSLKATFFVLGWVAERYPDVVKRIHEEGHEIACHGYAHQLIYNQSEEEFRGDIRKAKAILEDITGDVVVGYRAPSYSIIDKSKWAFEVLIEEGFKYDSSIFPIRHDFYGMPKAPRFPFVISLNKTPNVEFSVLNYELTATHNSKPINQNSKLNTQNSKFIMEFPLSTIRLFGMNLPISGGGYFRLFPYALIRKGLKSINEKESRPFIFYLHPWEIDADQPRVNNLSPKSRFRHYVNLTKTEEKFKKLIEDFQFSPIRHLLIQNS